MVERREKRRRREEGGGIGGEGWGWKGRLGEGSTTVEGYRSGRVKYPSDGQFSGKVRRKERSRERGERKIECSTREKERESELFAH